MNGLIQLKVFSIGLSLLFLGCAPSTSMTPTVEPSPSEASAQSSPEPRQSLPLTAQIEVSGQVIQLEVAQTPEQQEIGLMNRTSLAEDQGMLFPFEPPRPVQFWMRNTLIPLDMVFLLHGEIKAIVANVPPCTTEVCPTYGPATSTDQVIELQSGRAAAVGLQVGQQIRIQPIRP